MNMAQLIVVEDLRPQTAALISVANGPRGLAPDVGQTIVSLGIGQGLDAEIMLDALFRGEELEKLALSVDRNGLLLDFLLRPGCTVQALNDFLADVWKVKLPKRTGYDKVEYRTVAGLSARHATMVNLAHRGALLSPGASVVFADVAPASLVFAAANAVESALPGVQLSNVDPRSGRLVASGRPEQMESLLGAIKALKS